MTDKIKFSEISSMAIDALSLLDIYCSKNNFNAHCHNLFLTDDFNLIDWEDAWL